MAKQIPPDFCFGGNSSLTHASPARFSECAQHAAGMASTA